MFLTVRSEYKALDNFCLSEFIWNLKFKFGSIKTPRNLIAGNLSFDVTSLIMLMLAVKV